MTAQSKIYFLFKLGQRNHLEQFVQGKLYMNTARYFAVLEEKERGDKYEGTSHLFQSSRIQIKIGTGEKAHILSQETGLVDVVKFSFNRDAEARLFCMFALALEAKEQTVSIDQRLLTFGDSLAIITNANEFFRRVDNALDKRGYWFDRKHVEYVATNEHHGEMGLFRKPKEYEYQSEYRIAVRTSNIEADNIVDAGTLEDIAVLGESRQLLDLQIVKLDK